MGELSPQAPEQQQARGSMWVKAGWSPTLCGPQGCSQGVGSTRRAKVVPNPSLLSLIILDPQGCC